MTPENWLAFAGFGSTLFMLYRINLVLSHEFSEEDPSIKDPLGYAVSESIDFRSFKDESWRGFHALWAAMRFRAYYKRFMMLVCPREARIISLLMLGALIAMFVVVQIVKADPKFNGTIGAAFTAINALWWSFIEYGRGLKKTMDRLRVVTR